MTTPCPLLKPNGCGWCGRTLKGRQTVWCSRTCARTFTANHRWTQAKAQAKAEVTYYICANATRLLMVAEGDQQHATFTGPLGCHVVTPRVDVDHITPCLGKHGTWGCHHHAENLRVLCVPCHKEVTKAQHAAGELRPAATNGELR